MGYSAWYQCHSSPEPHYNNVAKIMAYHALGRPDCTIRFIAYIPRQYCYGNFGKKILGEWEIYQKRGGVCCLDI